jgi:hypothetical protein
MQVTVLLSDEVAAALIEPGSKGEAGQSVVRKLKKLGFELRPTHPEAQDPVLRTHFFVEVSDPKSADKVISLLTAMPSVKAAYIKPAEEPP